MKVEFYEEEHAIPYEIKNRMKIPAREFRKALADPAEMKSLQLAINAYHMANRYGGTLSEEEISDICGCPKNSYTVVFYFSTAEGNGGYDWWPEVLVTNGVLSKKLFLATTTASIIFMTYKTLKPVV